MSRRERGGFSIPELLMSTGGLVVCVIAFFLLGRLGWAWWVRIPVIVAGLYGLVFLVLFLFPGDGPKKD